jgi:hypothetical protein
MQKLRLSKVTLPRALQLVGNGAQSRTPVQFESLVLSCGINLVPFLNTGKGGNPFSVLFFVDGGGGGGGGGTGD